jgi:hypothetical protein
MTSAAACTAAALTPRFAFVGLLCHAASLYPACECPVPRACSAAPAPPCVSWQRGSLTLPPPPPPPPLECGTRADDFDAPGAVRTGRWLPAVGCPAAWLSPTEAHYALAGRHVIIMGDSLLRQLFNRLVWHLRGLEEVVEHYFHAPALYARNATHDALRVNRTDFGQHHSAVHAPTFVLHFLWAPALEAASLHAAQTLFAAQAQAQQQHSAVLVAGVNYWVPDGVPEGEDAARADAVAAVARAARARLLWAATPPRDGADGAAHNGAYAARNALYRARWAREKNTNTAAAAATDSLDVRVLPADALAASGAFPRTSDGIHFQCGFEVEWGTAIPASRDFVKTPSGGDCRDMHNLNLVMMALALLQRGAE